MGDRLTLASHSPVSTATALCFRREHSSDVSSVAPCEPRRTNTGGTKRTTSASSYSNSSVLVLSSWFLVDSVWRSLASSLIFPDVHSISKMMSGISESVPTLATSVLSWRTTPRTFPESPDSLFLRPSSGSARQGRGQRSRGRLVNRVGLFMVVLRRLRTGI